MDCRNRITHWEIAGGGHLEIIKWLYSSAHAQWYMWDVCRLQVLPKCIHLKVEERGRNPVSTIHWCEYPEWVVSHLSISDLTPHKSQTLVATIITITIITLIIHNQPISWLIMTHVISKWVESMNEWHNPGVNLERIFSYSGVKLVSSASWLFMAFELSKLQSEVDEVVQVLWKICWNGSHS